MLIATRTIIWLLVLTTISCVTDKGSPENQLPEEFPIYPGAENVKILSSRENDAYSAEYELDFDYPAIDVQLFFRRHFFTEKWPRYWAQPSSSRQWNVFTLDDGQEEKRLFLGWLEPKRQIVFVLVLRYIGSLTKLTVATTWFPQMDRLEHEEQNYDPLWETPENIEAFMESAPTIDDPKSPEYALLEALSTIARERYRFRINPTLSPTDFMENTYQFEMAMSLYSFNICDQHVPCESFVSTVSKSFAPDYCGSLEDISKKLFWRITTKGDAYVFTPINFMIKRQSQGSGNAVCEIITNLGGYYIQFAMVKETEEWKIKEIVSY